MSKTGNSPNASAAAFGWDFQVNAGIVLMLCHIEDAQSIKIEGMKEDIEVVLSNNKKIYAQAKSSFTPENPSNILGKLKHALETLNEAAHEEDAGALVYVVNFANVFSDIRTILTFSAGITNKKYHELPEICKEKIDDLYQKIGADFHKEDLSIIVLGFSGDPPDRYRNVKYQINEFLDSIDLSDYGYGQRALETWQCMFKENASSHSKTVGVTKKQMIWPLIVWGCKVNCEDALLSDCDDAEIDEIKAKYESVINDATERFDFVAKVMGEYASFDGGTAKGRERQEEFVRQKWSLFESDFYLSGADGRILEKVVKVAVNNVIRSRIRISSVKQKVNL